MRIIDTSFFKDGKILIHPKRFVIAKTKRPIEGAVVTIQDGRELTVVAPEEAVIPSVALETHSGWRWLTFDMDIPLDTVGFFAPITKALADAGVGVDIYSAFSTDHLLIRDADLGKAILALEGLGFKVQEK